ncbi:MAG: hypothetical protein SCH66_12760 [Methanolobus sp.]|nr:hypothetical protein [Methanolobus sp.]
MIAGTNLMEQVVCNDQFPYRYDVDLVHKKVKTKKGIQAKFIPSASPKNENFAFIPSLQKCKTIGV